MLQELAKYLEDKIKMSLASQKHNATGSLSDSIEVKVVGGDIIGYQETHGKYVDSGRKKGKYIPIAALEQWLRVKGIGEEKERKGIAFAISRKAFKEGIPMQPYKNWSEGNGLKRTGFLTDVLEQEEGYIFAELQNVYGKDIEAKIDNIIAKWRLQ